MARTTSRNLEAARNTARTAGTRNLVDQLENVIAEKAPEMLTETEAAPKPAATAKKAAAPKAETKTEAPAIAVPKKSYTNRELVANALSVWMHENNQPIEIRNHVKGSAQTGDTVWALLVGEEKKLQRGRFANVDGQLQLVELFDVPELKKAPAKEAK